MQEETVYELEHYLVTASLVTIDIVVKMPTTNIMFSGIMRNLLTI